MRKRSKKKYYKDLDLIRVIACIAILLYHLNILKGGYLAVCIFFVLSGYLTCVSAFKKEKFSLKEYYKNRLLKIYLPLLVVVFITISVISFIPNINFLNLKSETTSVIFGYNNFWQLSANLDYFTRHINSPFMHLWYISILLQFDLIFPFMYLLLRKIGEKFNKFIPCIVTGLLCIIFSIYFYTTALTNNIMVTYYNTFSRVFSLLFGVWLGVIHSYYSKEIYKKLKKINNSRIIFYSYILILIILFIFIDSKSVLFPISMILTTLITCRLIDYGTIIIKEDLNKFDKFIKFLSSISYEIYLVQYPIIFLFQSINIEYYLKLPIIIILVFIISYLMHILLNFNKNQKYRILKYIISGVILCIALFGVYKYIITPDHTKEMKKLEEQLSKNQEIIKQKQKDYELQIKKEEEAWLEKLENIENGEDEIKNIVSNLPIVGVGDSVLLGAVENLYSEFPNGYFDGKVSRTPWELNGILKDLKNKNLLGNPVVLNLGANGDCSMACKQEIMETLKDRQVFWINVTNDKDVNVNSKLASLANDYSNLHIIDWNSISSGHTEYFYVDGIHLTNVGREAYTKAIYDEIYKMYLDEYRAKKEELLKQHEEEQKNKISFYGNDILLYSFDYIQKDFKNSNFNINSEFNYEKLKNEIEESINNNYITKTIVFAFDSSFNITLEEYKDLINMCKNSKVYILSTNDETIKKIYNLNIDNVTIIDFYKEIKSNSNYLTVDKIHLTNEGNLALKNLLKKNIK